MNTLYAAKDYKEFLQQMVKAHRHERGYLSRLAEATGCHKSFLSQVLNSHVHLTPDHAASLAEFWKFGADDSEYFLLLVNLERAGSVALRRMLEGRARELKKRQAEISRHHAGARQADENFTEYYTCWYFSAIHILVGIPGFQTASRLSERLLLPEELVLRTLEKLARLKLVRLGKGGAWEYEAGDLFLSRTSPLVTAYHTAWRERAMFNSQLREADSIHYSVVYSLAKRDVEKLRMQLMDFIEEMAKTVRDSPNEELIAVNCDLFRV